MGNAVFGIPSSETSEPLSTKLRKSTPNYFEGWRLNAIKVVIEAKLFPPESADLMERYDIDPFHITEACGDSRNVSKCSQHHPLVRAPTRSASKWACCEKRLVLVRYQRL
jgi:hypothetical protein